MQIDVTGLSHKLERTQLAERRPARQFIDLGTLTLLREVAGLAAHSRNRLSPASVWRPRGRVAIYPALSTDQWQSLGWNALAGPTPAWVLGNEGQADRV